VLGRDREVLEFFCSELPKQRDIAFPASQLPRPEDFWPAVCMGVESSDGSPVAAVVFSNYRAEYQSIDISCMSRSSTWLTKSLVSAILNYPFSQLGCHRVQAITPRRATSARRFLKKLRFTEEGVARAGFGIGQDAVLYSMLRPEWASHPLNEGVDGQAQTAHAA
jgi:RimJ/RimL family protein N-acetyltransferase